MGPYHQCTHSNTYMHSVYHDSNAIIGLPGDQYLTEPVIENNISFSEQPIYRPVFLHNFEIDARMQAEARIANRSLQPPNECNMLQQFTQDQMNLEDQFVEGLLQFGNYEDVVAAAATRTEETKEKYLNSQSDFDNFSDNSENYHFFPSSNGLMWYSSEFTNDPSVNTAQDPQPDICPDLVPIMPPMPVNPESNTQVPNQPNHLLGSVKPMLAADPFIQPIIQPIQQAVPVATQDIHSTTQRIESFPTVPVFQTNHSSEFLEEPGSKCVDMNHQHLEYFDPKYFDPDSVEKAYRFFVKAIDYFSDKKHDGDCMFSPKQRAQEAMQLTIRCSASFKLSKASFVTKSTKYNREFPKKTKIHKVPNSRSKVRDRNGRKKAGVEERTEDEHDGEDREEEEIAITKDLPKTRSKEREAQQEVTQNSEDSLGNAQLNFNKPIKENDTMHRILSDKNLRKQLDDVVMRAWRRRGSRVNRKSFIYKIVKSPVVCPYKECIFSVLGFRGEKVKMNHIEACHKRINSLQCDICGLQLSRSDALIRHIKQQHSNKNKKSKKKSKVTSQDGKVKTGLPDEIPLELFADPKSFKLKQLNSKFKLESIIKEKEEKLRIQHIDEEQIEIAVACDYLDLKPEEKAAYSERTREACLRSITEQKKTRQKIEQMKFELKKQKEYRASFEKYDFDLLYARAIENSKHGYKKS